MTFGLTAMAEAQTKLTMYYPVAVGGPLTQVVDGIVADFMQENPDIKDNAIYAPLRSVFNKKQISCKTNKGVGDKLGNVNSQEYFVHSPFCWIF